jgi:hypothetical protein
MSWRPREVTGMFSRRSGRGVAQVVKHALDLAFFFFSFPYFSNINQIQKYIYIILDSRLMVLYIQTGLA